MKSKQPIIHPWLLAIFPALFLYSHNTGIVALSDIIRPMLLLLVGTSLLFILLSLVFRNRCKTGLVLSLFFTLFFAYGHIHSLMPDLRLHIGPYVLYPNTVLFPIWSMVLLIGAFIIIRSRSNLIKVSTGVNIIASLLIFVSVVTAAGGLIGGGSDDGGGLDRATSTVVAGQRPDIYYIILDGYTGNDVLRETFEFDNGSFTEYLRGRGFHVANKSRSNYCQTILSLASSLNFTYLDEIAAELGESSSDRKPLIRMIRDSRARRFLKSKGYDFAAYSSGYNATEITAADIYIAQSGSMSEFEGILLNMTPVPVVMRKMNSRQMHRERIMFTFDALSKRPESDHPLFVFAHIVCPHPPFVLGPDGKEILSGEFQIAAQGRNGVWPTGADEEKNYVGQITYVNNRLQKIINHLLDNSETSPIIILQGDHGSLFPRDSAGNVKTAYEEKFSILQALYLPGREDISFGDDISPCNSFRVIFNQYFKADFELFENRSYFSSWEEPYRFIDVSEVVGRSARDTIAVDD